MKKWYQKWWGILLIIFLLIFIYLLTSFGFKFWQEYQGITQGLPSNNSLEQQTELTGVVEVDGEYVIIPTVDDDPSIGPDDAKVTVISFQDFQCPYCGQEFPAYRATIANYQDRVRFVFRDFAYPPEVHAMAETAALAGECAQDQGKFWELHDQMFLHQDELSTENIKTWATQIGLDTSIFSDCLDQETHRGEIAKDFQDGQYGGVDGTPTFFVNGYKIQGTISQESWSNILDKLLELTSNQ